MSDYCPICGETACKPGCGKCPDCSTLRAENAELNRLLDDERALVNHHKKQRDDARAENTRILAESRDEWQAMREARSDALRLVGVERDALAESREQNEWLARDVARLRGLLGEIDADVRSFPGQRYGGVAVAMFRKAVLDRVRKELA